MSEQSVFRTEPRRAWLIGVCAGLATRTGLDVTLVRIATVVLTAAALGPVGLVAYVAAGLLAPAASR